MQDLISGGGLVAVPSVDTRSGSSPSRQVSSRPGSARPATARPNSARAGPPLSARPRTAVQNTAAAAAAGHDSVSKATVLSVDDGKAFLVEHFREALVAQLSSSVWKERNNGMAEILETLPKIDARVHGLHFLLALSLCPGWKDSNFQVLSKLCEACTVVLKGLGSLSKADSKGLLLGSLDKLADAKVKGPASELMLTLAEVCHVFCSCRFLFMKSVDVEQWP
jgi:cytoskeleton-associated protein 5